jgi:predicted ribosomally synthesized peptide with SipW-like signal peptide
MGISMKTTSGKILASVALVGTAAAVAGMGTYGAFTSTTNASQAVTAGTTVISLTGTNTLAVAVTGLLPGDSVEKFVTLSNPAGNSDLNGVTLSTTNTAPVSLLTSDPTNGLQVTIESCTTAWTVVAVGADTCSGTPATVLAKTSIIGANRTLANLASLTAAGADNLKVTTSLPTTADNNFQGLTSTIDFAFTGTQRTGTVK